MAPTKSKATTTAEQHIEFVRLIGDIVEVVDERIVKQIPIDEFTEKLVGLAQAKAKGSAISTPCLPIGTRFYVRKGGYEYFVIEQQPRKRVVLTGPDDHPGFFNKQKSHQFAMPYVIFVVQAPEGANKVTPGFRVFFSREPLRTMDDPLLIAPLPNLDMRGTICVGSTPVGTGGSTVEAVEDVIANFWGSSFRYGGQAVFPGFYPNNVRPNLFDNWGSHGYGEDFAKWSDDSTKNGDLFGLEIPWDKSKYTVRMAIEKPEKGIGQ